MIYLDTSAAAKALIDEDGTDLVRDMFAEGAPFVASRLLAVELHAVADRRALSHEAVQELLDRVALVALSDEILSSAIALHSGLRTLDALHLAAALEIRDSISGVLTFDQEFAKAAVQYGLQTVTL